MRQIRAGRDTATRVPIAVAPRRLLELEGAGLTRAEIAARVGVLAGIVPLA
jgi:hypothetical protein